MMGILSSILEKRSQHPRDPAIAEWLGGGVNTAAGIAVTPDSAMREAAVYACVRVLAESVAQLPLFVYRRRKSGGKDKASDHSLYEILHTRPNRWQTSFEYRESLMGSVTLRGNAVSRIVATGGGGVSELIPLMPDRVKIFRAPDGRRAYRYRPESGQDEILLQNEVLHVPGLSIDGLSGLAPITYHRETVGASLALREFGSRLFKNGTHIGTVFEHPNKLTESSQKNLKKSLDDNFSGVANANKSIILEEGMKIAKLGMTSEDAQYLESRKFSRSEIASIFRVPLYKIAGDTESTKGWSTLEQQSTDFVTDTLMPWLVRIEQAIARDLLTATDRRNGIFAEFNVMGLLRGDAAARSAYYTARFNTGSLSPNQIRELENENPQDGGDVAFVPMNMIPIDQVGRSDGNTEEPNNG
jgi:HK97 family phage portal protein